MKFIGLVSILLFGTHAFAASVGPAGCGLGNLAFQKESQVLAATTNGTFASQLFGITSGTSNCEQAGGLAMLDVYIEGNGVALSNDIARGQGETLAGVGQILDCKDVSAMGAVLKQNYSEIYPSSNVSTSEVSQNLKSVLKQNNVECSLAG